MKRRQRIIEKAYQEIAQKTGVSYKDVTEVEDSMWKMTKGLISTRDNDADTFPVVYLRFLGTVFTPANMIKRLRESKKRKKLNENT